jgi:ABC-type phosphonate transport system ATPase subunit
VCLDRHDGATLCCSVLTQAILDNSRSPYAQLLASASLIKLVTDHQLT